MAMVKIWGRGQLTIPASLRRECHMDDQTLLSIFKAGDVLVLTPKKMLGDTLARKVERRMAKTHLSLDNLLKDLKKERVRYNREKYGA